MPETTDRISPELTETYSHGGKADGLLFLRDNGFSVPRFFVLSPARLRGVTTPEHYRSFVNKWRIENHIADHMLWAARSSATVEDGREKSYAGLFHTEIYQSISSLPAALQKVREGFEAAAALPYHDGEEISGSIIIQEMINPDFAGVGFSKSPLDGSGMLINLVPGIGATLVSGEATALTIRWKNGAPVFEAHDEVFEGKQFGTSYETIYLERSAFVGMVKPMAAQIRDGIMRIEKLKGIPVDVEFAVINNTIYWLQVRPVTTLHDNKEAITWDNTNIGENYPGVTTPLSISIAKRAYGISYAGLARFIGANAQFIRRNELLLNNMVGAIDGAMYYNVTAWQQLLWQAPFGKRLSRMITKMWGMPPADFSKPGQRASAITYLRLLLNFFRALFTFRRQRRRYIQEVPLIIRSIPAQLLAGMTHAQLIETYLSKEKQFGEKWVVPMFNGMLTMIVFSLLKRTLAKSKLAERYPNYFNDILYASGDVISVSVVQDLQKLVRNIRADETAELLFRSDRSNEDISAVLQTSHPVLWNEMKMYIEKYGVRCEAGELRIEAVNYQEDSLKFIEMLRNNMELPTGNNSSIAQFNYPGAIRKTYSYNFLRRWYLLWLSKATINRVRDRENFRFMRTRFFSVTRTVFRAMDAALLRNNWISHANDSLFLEASELFDPGLCGKYKELIAQRKRANEIFQAKIRAPRYIQRGSNYFPVYPENSKADGDLRGVGCCSGVVEGEIVCVNELNRTTLDAKGKILVARYFEPGWLNLFASAAGLISERGSLLSHTAILCREMGIPSIVGANGITRKLKTGERVRMNGANGVIELIS